MCIRDSIGAIVFEVAGTLSLKLSDGFTKAKWVVTLVVCYACLLYTSDAADERSSVDLGGRRIIKKKKNDEDSKSEVY